jgi:geranylgeranyl diphosphate synthase type I
MGAAGAILAGDFASALAQGALLGVPVAPERVLDAAREFARLQRDVTLGQAFDVVGGEAPLETAYALKTGSYTVRGPLLVGAALAGASADTRAALERYARPLGIAFQLQDDLLGTFGDAVAIGKPVGADLGRGKRTSLVVEMEKDAHGSHLLARVLGVADAPAEEILALTRRMVESGARARVEARVTALVGEALAALDDFAITPALRGLLTGAASALAHRER